MGTTSRGRKPDEWASKVNHTHIINDPIVKSFLENCSYPKEVTDENKDKIQGLIHSVEDVDNPIEHILAVDGGYTVVEVNKNFPSSELAFFQFGALLFDKKDLINLSVKPFILPEDMQKLQTLKRFKLVLPIKNINYKKQSSLTNAFRKTLYDFFIDFEGICLMETLEWFIFETYKPIYKGSDSEYRKLKERREEGEDGEAKEDYQRMFYTLGNNPNGNGKKGDIELCYKNIKKDYTFTHEDGDIYLTDVFRFHEVIDNDLGAAGVLGYVTRLIEQIIIFNTIREIYYLKPALLNKFLFIADGPLSFSGQTATMHKPARSLCKFLIRSEKYNLYLVGVEKSGAFVEHAYKVSLKEVPIYAEKLKVENRNEHSTEYVGYLKRNNYLIPSNEYIYTYITIGDSLTMTYGKTSYYSGKVLFHSKEGQVIVISIPTEDPNLILNPTKDKYANINVILKNIELLKCDMYDNSLVPIALANKLVSLANHPSQVLMKKFVDSNLN